MLWSLPLKLQNHVLRSFPFPIESVCVKDRERPKNSIRNRWNNYVQYYSCDESSFYRRGPNQSTVLLWRVEDRREKKMLSTSVISRKKNLTEANRYDHTCPSVLHSLIPGLFLFCKWSHVEKLWSARSRIFLGVQVMESLVMADPQCFVLFEVFLFLSLDY